MDKIVSSVIEVNVELNTKSSQMFSIKTDESVSYIMELQLIVRGAQPFHNSNA